MSRLLQITASALAIAALSPVVADADANELRGAPQMVRTSADTVQVRFALDEALGRDRIRVRVADAGTGRTAKAAGRHGTDVRYVATVKVARPLQVGRKYAVRIAVGDDAAQTRLVLLRAR